MKAELSDLSLKGFSQYDFEYDKVAQELATITAAKKQYDAEMKNRGKAELGNEQAKATGENLRKARKELTLFERALNGIKGWIQLWQSRWNLWHWNTRSSNRIPESAWAQCRRYCWKEYMESFARTVDVVFIIFTSWRVKSPGSIPCTIK